MNIYYHPRYNIDLGPLNALHPFDGKKFSRVYDSIKALPDIVIKQPANPISQEQIEGFVNLLMKGLLHRKRYILRALEVPYIPLLPFSLIDKRILLPMRWAVAGTLMAATDASQGQSGWNLAGGYHHASTASAQGFCIYNDIGIAYQTLLQQGQLRPDDRILIIDIDAHHGNGNAMTFLENRNVTILDIYNDDIYPSGTFSKTRVDIPVPLPMGTEAGQYLQALSDALNRISGGYRLAFVIAGTDVIASDPLGGFALSIDDCIERDRVVMEKLASLSITPVYLGGGGYSKDSAKAIAGSLRRLYRNF